MSARLRAAACTGALLLAHAASAAAFMLGGHVFGQGATPPAGITGGGVTMLGTLGQPVTGVSGDTALVVCHGFWCFGGARVLDAPPGGGDPGRAPALPASLEFGRPRPSPSRGPVTFTLALPRSARVELAAYDLSGRVVDRGEAVELAAGWHDVRWTRAGTLPAGVYFARLRVDGRAAGERRVVITR